MPIFRDWAMALEIPEVLQLMRAVLPVRLDTSGHSW